MSATISCPSSITSFFSSVTTRTAGFNTIDFGDLGFPALLLVLMLMFIGAASGSTGGGIKTSTFFIVVASTISTITGRHTIEFARRSIPNELLNKALSVVVYAAGVNAIYYIEVPDNHVGLLKINGKLEGLLKPGNYGYWRFNRNIEVTKLDCRLQTMEVSGQEILTKDRVSLRINLSASYRIADTEKVATLLKNHSEFLYREFQLALREVVGTRTLDAILQDKDIVNQVVENQVKEKALTYGLEVLDVGVKDIILPGDMKSILNQVVEAQKCAEANLIKRREETQATRSLHNTAKVMEGNATLMRLKELEVLERITGKIDQMTVYNGLEGVMKDMVKIAER